MLFAAPIYYDSLVERLIISAIVFSCPLVNSTGQPHDLPTTGGQTVCSLDKTTWSLSTMSVWNSLKSKLQCLPQSTALPHTSCSSGNSISAHKLMGLEALSVTVSES